MRYWKGCYSSSYICLLWQMIPAIVMNAMTVVQVKAPSTFFLTIIFDVKGREVKALLCPGESLYDWQDAICWIHYLKHQQLLGDILKKQLLDVCDDNVCVVEFQKRGALHLHVLIWINNFKYTPKNINNYIITELLPQDHPMHNIIVMWYSATTTAIVEEN